MECQHRERADREERWRLTLCLDFAALVKLKVALEEFGVV